MNCNEMNVFKFIRNFSCFEYAMKETAYLKDSGGRAEPDWESFVKKCGRELDIPENNLLLSDPPQVQKVIDGKAKFEANCRDNGKPSGERAIYAMKTVRNNLFHGGKLVRQEDFPRDYELIEAAQFVLDKCLSLNKTIAGKHKSCLSEHINRSRENGL